MDSAARLLLVEEDDLLADIISFRLELLGYHVQRIRAGEQLLQEISQDLPHLILMDRHLPDMDGIDLVNRVNTDPRTNPVPILMFSIDSDLEQVERAFTAGANDYLVIPFDPTVLEDKIERLLEATIVNK